MMQIGARGSLGDAEEDADLAMAETFDVMQNDHRPLPVSEPSERVAQARAQVGRFGGVARVRGKRLRELTGVAYFAAPGDVEGGVGHDSMKPSPERLIGSKPIEGAIGVEKPFLNCILGVLVRRNNSAGNSIGTPLVHAHQGPIGLGVAALCGKDQGPLVNGRWRLSQGSDAARGCDEHVFPGNGPVFRNVAVGIVARAG